MKYTLYEVGGAVRDSLLGLVSKDIDYTVVITECDGDALIAFNWFHAQILEEGYQVFLVTPDVFTIRAKFPKGHKHEGLVADFVLARKESGFIEGTRRPLNVELGTLEDDLRRRDFTVNAIARDMHGNIIDPFLGELSLSQKALICPIDPETSFKDDPLRILRAFRFSVTKGLKIGFIIKRAIKAFDHTRFIETVSIERIREELDKMFRFDTSGAFDALTKLKKWNPEIYEYIIQRIWFRPTTENK